MTTRGRVLTLEDAIIKVEVIHGKGTLDFSNSEYIRSRDMTEFKCNICGTIFYKSWNKLISNKNRKACGNCARNKTKAEFGLKTAIEKSIEKHGDVWDFTNSEYINSHSKTNMTCKKCGRVKYCSWSQHLHHGLNVSQCKCSRHSFSILHASDSDILNRITELHGDKYVLISGIWDIKSIESVVTIYCNACKCNFNMQAGSFLCNGCGCAICGHKKSAKLRKSSFKLELAKLTAIHEYLTFSQLKPYKNVHDLVKCTCLRCGTVSKKSIKELKVGYGCVECGILSSKENRQIPTSELLEKAKIKHPSRFKYIDTPNGINENVTYICKACNTKHTVCWKDHIRYVGCPVCDGIHIAKHTIETVKDKTAKLYGNTIEILATKYLNSEDIVPFKCNICQHVYHRSWHSHLKYTTCPNCITSRPTILYYVQVIINSKIYYKIGITTRSVESRFGSQQNIQTIAIRIYPTNREAWEAEYEILNHPEFKQFKNTKYIYMANKGCTELFTKNILDMQVPINSKWLGCVWASGDHSSPDNEIIDDIINSGLQHDN